MRGGGEGGKGGRSSGAPGCQAWRDRSPGPRGGRESHSPVSPGRCRKPARPAPRREGEGQGSRRGAQGGAETARNPPKPAAHFPGGLPALSPAAPDSHGQEPRHGGLEPIEDVTGGEGHEVDGEGRQGEDEREPLVLGVTVWGTGTLSGALPAGGARPGPPILDGAWREARPPAGLVWLAHVPSSQLAPPA